MTLFIMSMNKVKGKRLLFLFLIIAALICRANEYKLTNVKVGDGDNVKAAIHLGFNIVMPESNIRISNINAPETRTKYLVEKEAGLLVKEWLHIAIINGSVFILKTDDKNERDKFGRPIGILYIDGVDIGAVMILNKFAVPYYGKKKADWLSDQLEYIIKTINKGAVK